MYDAAFYMPWIGPLLRPGRLLPTGGAETQIYLVTRALSRLGARVCIIAFETPEGLPQHLDGVDIVRRRPYLAHEPWFGKAREVLTTWDVLRRVETRVLVTRATGPYVPLVGAFARVARRRFIYSSASDGDFTSQLVDRYGRICDMGIRSAHTLVVQTDKQVTLSRRFKRPVVMIPSIVEPAPASSSRPLAFLWIGRLVDYKRPFEFVELARRLPEARFCLVGVPVPEGDAFAEQVRRAAAAVPNLTMLPPRARPELMAIVAQAVAIVNTSRDGLEGMPNTLLEGWIRGVPGLALSHDPDGIIGRHGLGGFAGGSLERLAELAAELWRERDDRQELSRRCRGYVQAHHAPEVVARQWMRVLAIERA
jgi:glycosyltransferase involved in cell wall biosynthesis